MYIEIDGFYVYTEVGSERFYVLIINSDKRVC